MRIWLVLICAVVTTNAWSEDAHKAHDMHRHAVNQHATYLSDPSLIRYYLPDLTSRELDKLELPKVGLEGYYALLLEKRQPGLLDAEVRYSHKNGRPIKFSPQALFGMQKTPLEIEPYPYPAEHSLYYSGKTWRFKLRFQGQPVPNQTVQFRSQNGSQSSVTTDGQGVLVIEFPDDFASFVPGLTANPPAEFSLTTELSADGQRYISRFKGEYRVSLLHWQSVPWGITVALIGAAFGVWLNGRLLNKPLKIKKHLGVVS